MNNFKIVTTLILFFFFYFCSFALSNEIDLDDADFSSFISSTKRLNKQTSQKIEAECEESAEVIEEKLHEMFTPIDSPSNNTNNAFIPPFSSCDQLYDTCWSICSGKSDKSPLLSLSTGGNKEKCEEKCSSAVAICEIGAKGETYDKIDVRYHFCSAICQGHSNINTCTDECKNDYNYWGW